MRLIFDSGVVELVLLGGSELGDVLSVGDCARTLALVSGRVGRAFAIQRNPLVVACESGAGRASVVERSTGITAFPLLDCADGKAGIFRNLSLRHDEVRACLATG